MDAPNLTRRFAHGTVDANVTLYITMEILPKDVERNALDHVDSHKSSIDVRRPNALSSPRAT